MPPSTARGSVGGGGAAAATVTPPADKGARLRYHAFSRLQSMAVAFGESLPIPEIVAIGGQSDGKSSLMEALLGFRFNVCSSEMGTRRPLIVQMSHDPAATTPRCRLQDEDGPDYGPVLPEDQIAEAIRARTEALLLRLGTPVASKPIVMRAEFAYCPNLTVIDTPGFILQARSGEPASTPDDILDMVKATCAPRHRLILFLQQSSVEWASSLWIKVVEEVDPQFSRTIMVASKFDNRLKEFSERRELETYLSASGYLPPNVQPFFVALPKDKSGTTATTSAEWRRAIAAVDAHVLRQMRDEIQGGFDQERWGPRVGFARLKQYLEEELAARYRAAAPVTLALLRERCAAAAVDVDHAESRKRAATDVCALRHAAIVRSLALASRVDDAMAGGCGLDPSTHGMTAEEERSASGAQWPEATVASAAAAPHADARLFGGAALHRLLEEFHSAIDAIPLPPVSREAVSNMLLAQGSRVGGNSGVAAGHAARQLAHDAASKSLAPMIDIMCARLGFILRRTFDAAEETVARELDAGSGSGVHGSGCVMMMNEISVPQKTARDDVQRRPCSSYPSFSTGMRDAFVGVVTRLQGRVREMLISRLATATSRFSVTSLALEHQGAARGQGRGNGFATAATATVAAPHRPHRHAQHHQNEHQHQYTVPETPSPMPLIGECPVAAPQTASATATAAVLVPIDRNVGVASPDVGRMAKAPRLDAMAGGYLDVCSTTDALFRAVKSEFGSQGLALKTVLLESLQPMALGAELCAAATAKPDDEFMVALTTPAALEALDKDVEVAERRVEGLEKMANEFEELVRSL